jgi:hypothetical protein
MSADELERSIEEDMSGEGAPELSEGTEATAEAEPGEGESVCAYGVEVVELLEMEPVDPGTRRPRKRVPWNKYASAAFVLAFVLGIINAGVSLYYSSVVVSPAEVFHSQSCELSGEVLDISGRPIPNATVVVTDATRSAFTNRDGWYVLKGLSPGNHRVEAAAEGYNTVSVKTDVQPNLLNIVDFTLEKGGEDVSVGEASAPDFGQPGSSYLWAVPMLIFFSICALAAAIISLRRKARWRATVILGALGALSFGFGAGSALAIAGAFMTALTVPESGPLPQKKLRVGVSYPSKRPSGSRAAGASKVAAAPSGPHAEAASKVAAAPSGPHAEAASKVAAAPPAPLRPAPSAEGASAPLESIPAAEGAAPELRPVPAAEAAGETPAARPSMLKDRTADGELEGPAAPMKGPSRGKSGAPTSGPKRLIRRSTREKLRCYTCVEEITPGSVYIRCGCGRTVHVRCLKEPRCPCCGVAFGRAAA